MNRDQAAHDVLVALYPAFQTRLDAELQQDLAQIPEGQDNTDGVTVGRRSERHSSSFYPGRPAGRLPIHTSQFAPAVDGQAGVRQVNPRCSSVPKAILPVGKAISLREDNFPIFLNENISAEVSAVNARLPEPPPWNCFALAPLATESDAYDNYKWPHGHEFCGTPCFNLIQLPHKILRPRTMRKPGSF